MFETTNAENVVVWPSEVKFEVAKRVFKNNNQKLINRLIEDSSWKQDSENLSFDRWKIKAKLSDSVKIFKF